MITGGIYGARTAASIPGPPQLKFGAGFLGFLAGSLLGETGTRKVQKNIFGEVTPVVPDLQKYAVAGDILPYGVSVAVSPWMLPRQVGGIGAVKFLDDFRLVSSSGSLRLPGPAGTSLNDKNLAIAARDAGLSVPNYLRAVKNLQKTQGSKKIRDMFRPDPSKGPVDMRIIAALERGLVTAGQAGRGELGAAPLVATGAIDLLSAAGSSFGGFTAESIAPNNLGYRIFGEVLGAGAPGVAGVLTLKSAGNIPNIFRKSKDIFKKYILRSPGVVNEAIQNDAVRRIFAALESSTELNSADDLNKFIEDLGSLDGPLYELDAAGKPVLDAAGKPIELKLTASNVAAAKNLPLQKTLTLIEDELSRAGDELSIQSAKGRANFIQGSKNMIMLLRKSGEPEAFKLAAEIEENLFTQNITDNMQAAINKLLSASERLTKINLQSGTPDAGPTSLNLAEKLNQLVRKQLTVTKARERELWSSVGNEEITTFFNADGEEILKPNILTYLDEIDFGGSKAAEQTFYKNLGLLNEDIKDLKTIFGEAADAIEPPNLEKITGTGGETYILNSLPGGERFQARRNELADEGILFSGDANQEREVTIRILREFAEQTSDPDLKGLTPAEAGRMYGVSGGLSTVRKMTSIFNEEADKLARIASDAGEDPGIVSVQRLQNMRKIAGDIAAELSKKNPAASREIEGFRAAILRDLLGNPEGGSQTELDTARAYTRARYSAFGTNKFPGKINNKTGRGEFVLSPDATVREYFQGGANPNLLRTQEILQAGEFMVNNGVADAALLRGNTTDVLEAILRDAQKNIFDKKVIKVMGKDTEVLQVNAAKLNRWKNDDSNKKLMSIFPNIAKDLESVETAQNLFDTLGKELKFLEKSDKVKAFELVVGSQNPSVAVSRALASNNPETALMELVGFANTTQKIKNEAGEVFTNDQARQGLMNGIVDHAVQYSGGGGGRFNPQAFFDFMFTPRPRGDLKKDLIVADFMVQNNLMSSEQLKTMKQATKEMINVDDALARGDLESVLFKNPTGMKMLQVKMVGATLGGIAQKRLSDLLKKVGFSGGGGGTLVAASEGSKQLQNILIVGPESIRQKYMVGS
jgi:hypothetical protein